MSDDLRDQIHQSMDRKETDELVALWKTNDHLAWTELAFDVVQEILKNRLGELPPQGEPINEHIEQDTGDESTDDVKKIDELMEEGDISGLVGMLENETDAMICLDAAKALAQLGDERGLDYLIGALDVPDKDVNFAAKEMLVELNNPRGNLALTSSQSSTTRPSAPGISEKLNAKYPYLTAYVGFIALYMLASVVIGFISLPAIVNLIIVIVIGYYIFKFVVQNNVLPYK